MARASALVLLAVALLAPAQRPASARAPAGCPTPGSRQAGLGGQPAEGACLLLAAATVAAGQAYQAHEIACGPVTAGLAARGLCAPPIAPCLDQGLWYALRTVHSPAGAAVPAGWSCVRPERATVVPGMTVAQVFAAVRRARPPVGRVTATPRTAGLAGISSSVWLEPVRAPVRLRLGRWLVQADFAAVDYRWWRNPAASRTGGPGQPPVVLEVVWTAEVLLDGQRVGRLDGLVSRGGIWFPASGILTATSARPRSADPAGAGSGRPLPPPP